MRAFSYALLKLVEVLKELISLGSVYEEEDHQPLICGFRYQKQHLLLRKNKVIEYQTFCFLSSSLSDYCILTYLFTWCVVPNGPGRASKGTSAPGRSLTLVLVSSPALIRRAVRLRSQLLVPRAVLSVAFSSAGIAFHFSISRYLGTLVAIFELFISWPEYR